ncbi:histidine kinase dimerization/phospho-acceptor domain-containing protein, partial [Streptomyces sp. NPDC002454]
MAACCAVAAVVGVLIRDAAHDRSMNLLRGQVTDRLAEAEQEYEDTGRVVPPVIEWDPAELPAPLARSLAEETARGLGAGIGLWYDTDPPNWYWMWGAVDVGDRMLVYRQDMSQEERNRQLLDRRILFSLFAALAVVVPLAALATEPVNRRLRYGARTARIIADGDLDARIGRPGRARDEITEMSAAVDEMAAALQRKLEDERRFTADVAHELRTPLMGLATAAGLLREDDEATVLVRDRVRALTALVEDLLEISRLDAGAERARPDRVPLGESRVRYPDRGESFRGRGGSPGCADDPVGTEPGGNHARRCDRHRRRARVSVHGVRPAPAEAFPWLTATGPVKGWCGPRSAGTPGPPPPWSTAPIRMCAASPTPCAPRRRTPPPGSSSPRRRSRSSARRT